MERESIRQILVNDSELHDADAYHRRKRPGCIKTIVGSAIGGIGGGVGAQLREFR